MSWSSSSSANANAISSRPSMSKRNGLAARFSSACADVALPSRPTMSPQHSFGASRTACATISSSRSRAIFTAERLDGAIGRLRLLELLGVVVVVAAGHVRHRLLELAHALAQRAADLGKLLRAEYDERDGQDEQQLSGTEVEWHGGRALLGLADCDGRYYAAMVDADVPIGTHARELHVVPVSKACGMGSLWTSLRRTTRCWPSLAMIEAPVCSSRVSTSLACASW